MTGVQTCALPIWLDAAGADVNRVYAFTWVLCDGEEKAVSLSDLVAFEKVFQEIKPALVVIDPIQAYLGAGVDAHRANEVRPIMAGLAGLAEKYAVAVVLIRHLGKGQQDRAVYRGLGSIDFSAAVRSMLLAGKDPNDETNRVMAHTKSNLAPAGPSISYSLGANGFLWGGISDVTGEQLLAPPRDDEEKSAIDEAIDFLENELADGPQLSRDIIKSAHRAGIADRTLKRARQTAGIKSAKTGKEWTLYKGTFNGTLGILPKIGVNTTFPATNQEGHAASLNGSRKPMRRKDLTQVSQGCHLKVVKDLNLVSDAYRAIKPAGEEMTDQ